MPSGAIAQPSDAAYALVNRLSAAMKRCWFMGGDPMFGDYVAAPEPNASGGPRILVVARSTPDGRPVLVVEILGGRSEAEGQRLRPARRRRGGRAHRPRPPPLARRRRRLLVRRQSLASTPSKRQPLSVFTNT
jgi:hypothetical protein